LNPCYLKRKELNPQYGAKEKSKGGVLYQLKNGCNWCDLPKDLPPYSTVFWHYKHWRTQGVIEGIRDALHSQVRQQVKKTLNGQP
jgi:transposase